MAQKLRTVRCNLSQKDNKNDKLNTERTRLRSKVRNKGRMKAKAFRIDALPRDYQTLLVLPKSLEALNCNLCGRMSLDRGAGSGMRSKDSFHVVVQKLFYLICTTFITERAKGKRAASLGLASTRKIPQYSGRGAGKKKTLAISKRKDKEKDFHRPLLSRDGGENRRCDVVAN